MLPPPSLTHLMLSAEDRRWEVYRGLMNHGCGLPNDDALAQMLSTQAIGGGALPSGLGLTPGDFTVLLARRFPGATLRPAPRRPLPIWDERLLEEKGELINLLRQYRAGADDSELAFSVIIATGCMSNDHLWEDLGLWSRRELSALMQHNFPALAAKNDRDMKWKRFLYKQLCEQEGIYLCRAPSCAVCRDYPVCFGPEE